MNRVMAVAIREVAERKLLLLGALLVGIITLLVPLAPIPGRNEYREVVDVSAYVFALLLMAGGGLVLGATTIGRDLSSGRIAFFFTRELHAWEIWMGRIAGMFASVVLAATIVLLPATMLGGGLRHLWDSRRDDELPVALIVAVLLPLAAHYMSVALRSRSAWLALDVVAVCAAAGALWSLALPFLPYWFNGPKAIGTVLGILTLVLAFAGWCGLAKGRITPVVVHRWSLLALWSLVAIALLAFAAWRAWVFAASPRELDWSKGWAYEIDGNGDWIGIGSGETKGRGGIPHEFLMSTKTGAWMRVDDSQPIAVSADSRVGAIAKRSWAWRPSNWIETTIQVVDLTAARLKTRDTGIVLPGILWNAPALSADGSRIAIVESKAVSVYSLPDETLLAAFPLQAKTWATALFLDDATLQVVASADDVTTVWRFAIDRKTKLSEVRIDGGRVRIDPTGSLVAVASNARPTGASVSIHDASSGAKRGEVVWGGSPVGRRFHWLSDGGFALATAEYLPRREGADASGESSITIHAVDGAERLRVPLAGAKRIAIVGEQTEGELLAAWSNDDRILQPCAGDIHLIAIDLTTGVQRDLPFKGWPRAFTWRAPAQRGSVSSRLFGACDGTMVMYDAASGRQSALPEAK